jgi:hypothetical protein
MQYILTALKREFFKLLIWCSNVPKIYLRSIVCHCVTHTTEFTHILPTTLLLNVIGCKSVARMWRKHISVCCIKRDILKSCLCLYVTWNCQKLAFTDWKYRNSNRAKCQNACIMCTFLTFLFLRLVTMAEIWLCTYYSETSEGWQWAT